MVSRSDVVAAYNFILGRDPDNEFVIDHWMRTVDDRASLSEAFIQSEEVQSRYSRSVQSPFWHYHSSFDAEELVRRHAAPNITPSPQHFTNFLGVRMRPEIYPPVLADKLGLVEGMPLPSAWHADLSEWGSCLRALEASGDHFTILELGCGWGCWMNNMGVAAKAMGKTIKLYGVEALVDHIDFARQALADNGISQCEYELIRGIAGKASNGALFPLVESGINWGGQAYFNPSDEMIAEKVGSGQYELVPIVDLASVFADVPVIDLLHVDIQGAELDLLTEMFDFISQKVRYVFIGTHSKQIEGGLIDLFSSRDSWKMEMERGAIFKLINGRPEVTGDGVQLWRNMGVASIA